MALFTINPYSVTETGSPNNIQSPVYMYDRDVDSYTQIGCDIQSQYDFLFKVMDAKDTSYTYTSMRAVIVVDKYLGWPEGYYDDNIQHFVGPYIQMTITDSYGVTYGIYDPTYQWTATGIFEDGTDQTLQGYQLYTLTIPYNSWIQNNIHIKIAIGGHASQGDYWAIREVMLYSNVDISHGYTQNHTAPTTTTPATLVSSNLWDSTNAVFNPITTSTPAVYEEQIVLVKPDHYDPATWYERDEGFWYLGTVY